MSTTVSRSRKLGSFVKCGRCRQDRQKCERPDTLQKCLRCAKFKHDCDAGRASNRAQRTQKLSVRQRAQPSERLSAAQSPTQHELLPTDQVSTSNEAAVRLKDEESFSSRTSRSASSERSTSWSTSEDLFPYENRHGSTCSIQWTSCSTTPEDSPASSQHLADYGWDQSDTVQRVFEYAENSGELEVATDYPDNVHFATVCPVFPDASSPMLSGLTNLQPSRRRVATPFEERLDNRVNRLWGNYKTFASASAKGLGVTPLFGRTLSELFRQSRQMAENGNDLVADVRMCCGAADACMNTKLPAQTRAQYLEAYHRYDARANSKYRHAVARFAQSIAEDESPDVLPLYTATFLYYAAGACMRGGDDLLKAVWAFKYFNQYTAWFPIRVAVLPARDGTWAADMLLANNSQDPGMRINTLMFALGRARLEFDRREGLC